MSNGCRVNTPSCNGDSCAVNFHLNVEKTGYYTQRLSGLKREHSQYQLQLTSKLANTNSVKVSTPM